MELGGIEAEFKTENFSNFSVGIDSDIMSEFKVGKT
jgi:hypothetical protein